MNISQPKLRSEEFDDDDDDDDNNNNNNNMDRGSTEVRRSATNRKVAGSVPDGVIGIFH